MFDVLKKIWKEDKPALAFYSLLVAGVVVCALTELEKMLPSLEAMCGGPSGGCATVRKSTFSTLFGIPLGYLGIVAYIVWGTIYRFSRQWAALFGGILLGAEIYFVYLQFSVIHAICVLCMTQFTIVFLLNLLLFFTAYNRGKQTAWRLAFILLAVILFAAFYFPAKTEAKNAAATATSITSWGDPKSDLRMEIFTDYECGHCRTFEAVVERVIKEYPEIYIIFRDYIIQGHKLSPMAAAYAGSVAFYQGREAYLKTRFELFDKQDALFDLLKMRLPMMSNDKDMEAAVDAKIKADMARAADFNVQGTPTTALIKKGETWKVLSGAASYEIVKAELDKFVGRK
jgi:uncharacterized membrane protein